MLVSIVIPVYNEAAYLPACLDAIAVQTLSPYEVIVVDNNSTDRTARIAGRYEFVRVLREPRQGIVHARNRGFDAARGDIIARIDADTQVSPTWLADITAAFERNRDVSAITGRCNFYDFPYSRLATMLHEALYYRLQAIIAGTGILWGSNMGIRRRAWRAARADCSLRDDVPEDIDLSLVLAGHGLAVRRESKVRAGVSLRRGRLSPRDVAAYLRWWPRVYLVHRRFAAAALIWLLYVSIYMAAVLTSPLQVVGRIAPAIGRLGRATAP